MHWLLFACIHGTRHETYPALVIGSFDFASKINVTDQLIASGARTDTPTDQLFPRRRKIIISFRRRGNT